MLEIDNDKAIIESYKRFLPIVKNWIIKLVEKHSSASKKVSDFGFSRLSLYYPEETLNSAKVVVVDEVPSIPLASFGLTQFKDFEEMELGGVTYLDTYFIRSDYVYLEPTHFHELVHIIQWKYLGFDNFLLLYGLGLLKNKYKNSPLEFLAYTLEEEFGKGNIPFNGKDKIAPELDKMKDYLYLLVTA